MDCLFPNTNILPEFQLRIIKAVQVIGGKGTSGYTDWFDALEHMKIQIRECDFDIALLGCGAYGLPLAAYIKQLGKQAIYVGGSLQLMFGIRQRKKLRSLMQILNQGAIGKLKRF